MRQRHVYLSSLKGLYKYPLYKKPDNSKMSVSFSHRLFVHNGYPRNEWHLLTELRLRVSHIRQGLFRRQSHSFFTYTPAGRQKSINASYYRGGTSRAIMFREEDLPSLRDDWAHIFRATIGSPDPNGRQLNGLGGGISSLSKICVVALSKREDADVDYTFVQVGVKNHDIDYSGNCGNITSAVGPFAFDDGIVKSPITNNEVSIRMYNTNTKKVIISRFRVASGESETMGDFAIDGVAGTAAKISLDFQSPAGSKTGTLFPTGNIVDNINGHDVTCADVSNPCIFVNVDDLDVSITNGLLPLETSSQFELLRELENIRRVGAVKMGLCTTLENTPASIPKICMVSKPQEHKILSGETIDGNKVDLVVRAISVGQPHLAVPITVSLCAAAMSKVRGSVVQKCLSKHLIRNDGVTIGHASGKLVVNATFDDRGHIGCATVYRTARRIMKGQVYYDE